jgi:hypothetical protein
MSHPYGWQALYRAVVLEADSRKLPHSIVLAEQAIKHRLLDGPSLQIDTAESQAMHKALDTLAVLKAEHTAVIPVRGSPTERKGFGQSSKTCSQDFSTVSRHSTQTLRSPSGNVCSS